MKANCTLSFFHFLLYFYHCSCISTFTRGKISKCDISENLAYSVLSRIFHSEQLALWSLFSSTLTFYFQLAAPSIFLWNNSSKDLRHFFFFLSIFSFFVPFLFSFVFAGWAPGPPLWDPWIPPLRPLGPPRARATWLSQGCHTLSEPLSLTSRFFCIHILYNVHFHFESNFI